MFWLFTRALGVLVRMINRRRKGTDFEYDTQKWMRDRGVLFRRVGMSGGLKGIAGDFIWEDHLGEAKCGSQVPKKIYDWLKKDNAEFLAVRRDREQRLWVITDDLMEELLIK